MKLFYDKNTQKLIVQESTTLEYTQVKLWLERYVENYQFQPQVKYGKWDGKINLFNGGKINFGLWKEVLTALQVIGGEFEIVNKKDFPLNRTIKYEDVEYFCKYFFKDRYIIKDGVKIPFFPYDHQIDAAFKILKHKYCVAELATSGGKTLVLSIVMFYTLLYLNTDAKLLLIVPSVSLVTQFYDDLIEFNIGKNKENLNPVDIRVQEIMGDKPRKWHGDGEPNIYISTYQSLSKIENFGEDFYKQFYMVVVDESHMAKVDSIKKILNLTMETAEYRFGVSGTFPKADTANWLTIQSVTGHKITSVRAKTLQDLGIITPIKIKCIHANHNAKEVYENLKKIRKNPNMGSEAYRLEGDFIRGSEQRLKLIWKIVEKLNSNTLIMFNIIDYGEKIRDILNVEYENYINIKSSKGETAKQFEFLYVDGGVSKKKREEIKKKMELKDGIIRIFIASYGTTSTGISINNIHNIILAEGFKAESRIIQTLGRALRLHEEKKQAIIYDIVDYLIEGSQNSYSRHGDKRKTLYNEHQYPYEIFKMNL